MFYIRNFKKVVRGFGVTKNMINKTIHYIWFGKKPYPTLIERCIESWKKQLPDFEFKLWNEDNAPVDIPYVKKALEKEYYAFAADYVRAYILYHEGGIYLDTDMEILKDLTPLLDLDFFLGYESANVISAGIIGSKKGHIISRLIMEKLDNSKNYETIPRIITEIFKKNDINDKNIKVFPTEYFYPYNPYDENRKDIELMYMDITEKTYAIHHWKKSWKLSLGDRIIRKINNKFFKK
jgi:mannosyltransferase OCH1-like enzyme